jgi:opacity protein-like surface antigen
MQKIPLLVAAGLVGMASAVSAAPVVQAINVDFAGYTGTNRVDFGSTLTAFNGILTSVLLEWDLTAAGGIRAFDCNTAADCEGGSVGLVIDSDFFAIYDKGTTPTGFNNDTDDAQVTDVTVSINGSIDLTGDATVFQGAGNLADFLFVNLGSNEFYSSPNGIATTGTLTLTYESSIAAVPLPGSLPLALVGLAGLAVLRRRRQRGAPTA